MILWIFVILTVAGVTGGIVACEYDFDVLSLFGWIVGVISGIVAAIMLIVIVSTHCTADAQVELWKEQYKALTYKLESSACRDELGLLSKEIIDEIQDWNQDVVYNKRIQKDFWMGIFYPKVFDEFETIDYERYQSKD